MGQGHSQPGRSSAEVPSGRTCSPSLTQKGTVPPEPLPCSVPGKLYGKQIALRRSQLGISGVLSTVRVLTAKADVVLSEEAMSEVPPVKGHLGLLGSQMVVGLSVKGENACCN